MDERDKLINELRRENAKLRASLETAAKGTPTYKTRLRKLEYLVEELVERVRDLENDDSDTGAHDL